MLQMWPSRLLGFRICSSIGRLQRYSTLECSPVSSETTQ